MQNQTERTDNQRPRAHAHFSLDLLKRLESKKSTDKRAVKTQAQPQALSTQTTTALPEANVETRKAGELDSPKYKTSSLSNDDIIRQVAALKEYLNREKPYLNLRLTLGDIANELNVANHHLSQIINIGMKSNFNTLINSYRIKESLNLLQQDTAERSNITRIQFDSGFSSKSVFHRVFKDLTGMTPKSFWDKCRAEDSTLIDD